jgi:hypothetical protein
MTIYPKLDHSITFLIDADSPHELESKLREMM